MFNSLPRSRILVVDDAPVVCEALRYVIEDTPDLEMVGEAGEGFEAVESAASLDPDVVILDIHLPDVDGYAVARELKSMPNPPLIVFLTVDGDPETQQRALEAGADAFVAKAQGWEVLLAKIRAALSTNRGENDL
jgi:DNA-binding NarL/FixJ family response regulator